MRNLLYHTFDIYRRTSSVQTSGEVVEATALSSSSVPGAVEAESPLWNYLMGGGGNTGKWRLITTPDVDLLPHDEILWNSKWFHVDAVERLGNNHHIEAVLSARR